MNLSPRGLEMLRLERCIRAKEEYARQLRETHPNDLVARQRALILEAEAKSMRTQLERVGSRGAVPV